MMARRISGSEGCGGGPAGSTFSPPPRSLQAPVLQIGKSDAGHQRVPVQAGPGPALEVAEPKLLLQLLVHLLTGPACLDGGSQTPQRRPRRQVAEVVFLLATVAPFADQPDRLTRQAHLVGSDRSIRDADPHGREATTERTFAAASPSDATPALLRQRLGRRAWRPVRHRMLARAPGRRARGTQPDRRRVDTLGAGDADGPGQPARVQPMAEAGAVPVAGVRQDAAEAQPRLAQPVD